ncbi:MAG: hypothetical protein ACOZEN_08715 [Thermodesulfobacteriota bacterium]
MNDQTIWDGRQLGNIDQDRKQEADLLMKADADLRRCFRQSFLDSEDGRKVLMTLSAYTRLLATTFTGNSVSYLNEGKRDVMLFILEMCGVRDMSAVALIMQAACEAEEELKHG